MFQAAFKAAPAMMGVARRKENLAAAGRFRLRAKPAPMVIPERDVPGTMASACAAPIATESARVTFPRSFSNRPFLSAHQRNRATPIIVEAMTQGPRKVDSA